MKISFILIFTFVQLITIHRIQSTAVEYTTEKSAYFVSVRDSNGVHICSGVIVKPHIILTSGQCDFIQAKYIIAGARSEQIINIAKVERKIGAFGERYLNLFFLEKNLQYIYNDVDGIEIATKDHPSEGSSGEIFGYTTMNGNEKIRSVDIEISNYDECKSLLQHPRYGLVVTCPFGRSKEEICPVLEHTSLLTCIENGRIKLCGAVFDMLNFSCWEMTNESPTKLMTAFFRLLAFKDWLKSYNIL